MDARLKAAYYFDLKEFPHPALFEDDEAVWSALLRLTPFLLGLDLGKIESPIVEGVVLVDPELITIGPGCVIEPGAYIKGPAHIQAGCQIRQGAYIRGSVIACEGAVIGHATEVKNSILLKGAQAAHFNYVGDSILGAKVNLGAGTKCANLKMNHSEISLLLDNERIATGLRKFGLIAGDGAQLGCNSVTSPGTCLGKGAFVYPCVNAGGFIPSHAHVKSPNRPEVVSGSP